MLGNDIIDLDDADADVATYSPRWSKRVFTRREAALVAGSPDPDRMRWSTWAAKEAAYKWARQRDPDALFSPPAFEVTFTPIASETARSDRRGHVDWRGERVPLLLEDGGSWLHARVDDAGPDPAASRRGVATLPAELLGIAEGPSRFVRRCVIRDALTGPLREADRLEGLELAIVRRGRIPELRSQRGRESASLSLSHHGRFVAWAWRPTGEAARRGSTVPTSNDSMDGIRV